MCRAGDGALEHRVVAGEAGGGLGCSAAFIWVFPAPANRTFRSLSISRGSSRYSGEQ